MNSESDSENEEIINTQIITLEPTKKFSIYSIYTRVDDQKKEASKATQSALYYYVKYGEYTPEKSTLYYFIKYGY
jgi:hypothetical protein